jgi:hypothetical protein
MELLIRIMKVSSGIVSVLLAKQYSGYQTKVRSEVMACIFVVYWLFLE